MDGMHRVGKAKILGKELISIVQFELDHQPDFINIDKIRLMELFPNFV